MAFATVALPKPLSSSPDDIRMWAEQLSGMLEAFINSNLAPAAGAQLTSSTLTSPTITGASITGATLTSPTITSPTITGGSSSGATLTSPTITSPTITGGSSSGATLTSPTITGAVVDSLNGGPLAGFRNRIINGGMSIDQRNSGAAHTITSTAAYTLDRWRCNSAGANATGQVIAGSGEYLFAYQITGAAGITAMTCSQRIDALNSFDFAGKTVSVSFVMANSLLTSVSVVLSYANSTNNFTTRTPIGTVAVTISSTMTQYSVQFSVPSGATTGLQVSMNVGAQVSGTWTIANVRIEAGGTVTPMERRPNWLELALCEDYYRIIPDAARMTAYLAAGAGINFSLTFPPMRATPTANTSYAATFNISNGPFVTVRNGLLTIGGNNAAAGNSEIIMNAITLDAEL